MTLKRRIKFLKQRLSRGFSDEELWNLDHTLVKYILPRLKAFKDYHGSYPPGLTSEKWNKKLSEMIWAFDVILHEEETMPEINEENKKACLAYFKRRNEGLKLFGKYLMDLWD